MDAQATTMHRVAALEKFPRQITFDENISIPSLRMVVRRLPYTEESNAAACISSHSIVCRSQGAATYIDAVFCSEIGVVRHCVFSPSHSIASSQQAGIPPHIIVSN